MKVVQLTICACILHRWLIAQLKCFQFPLSHFQQNLRFEINFATFCKMIWPLRLQPTNPHVEGECIASTNGGQMRCLSVWPTGITEAVFRLWQCLQKLHVACRGTLYIICGLFF